MTNQDKGREFEKYIHGEILSKIDHLLLSEKEVRGKYGNCNSAIDHLIETPELIICIQDKYEQTSSQISKINHFITCVKNIYELTKKKCIGLYLSLKPITKPGLEAFDMQNKYMHTYCNFISIFNDDQRKIFFELILFLYKNKIYRYDYDGSCIMLDLSNNGNDFMHRDILDLPKIKGARYDSMIR